MARDSDDHLMKVNLAVSGAQSWLDSLISVVRSMLEPNGGRNMSDRLDVRSKRIETGLNGFEPKLAQFSWNYV
jgi:hypothetical protein